MMPFASAGRSASSSSSSGLSIRSSVVGSSAVTDAARGSGTSAASSPTVAPGPRTAIVSLAAVHAEPPSDDRVQVLLDRALGDDAVACLDLDLGRPPGERRERAPGDVREQADPVERDDALDRRHRHVADRRGAQPSRELVGAAAAGARRGRRARPGS